MSLLTAPQLYGGLASALVWLRVGLGGAEALAALLLSHTALPLAPILFDAARGEVDIFVSERGRRWKYYLLSLLAYALGLAYATWRGYRLYAALTLSYAATAAALAAVTVLCRWKVSAHTAGIAGPTTALVLVVGREAAALYLLLAPVAWARLELGAHTPAQLAAGAAIAVASTLAALSAPL